jgi:hypothetical protein
MQRLMGTAQPALEHALTLVLLSSLIEHNERRGSDSIVVNAALVIKRMVAKRAEGVLTLTAGMCNHPWRGVVICLW